MRYRLRELCRLYLPWLFACLCVFACPPREHSSSLSLSLSLYYYSISLSRCIVLSLFWLSVSFYRYFVAHKPLQFTHRNTARWIRIRRERINQSILSYSFVQNPCESVTLSPSRFSLSFFRLVSLSIVDSSRSLSSCLPKRCRSMHHPPPPATTNHHHHTDSYDRSNSPHSLLFFFLIMHPNIRQSIYPREEWNK